MSETGKGIPYIFGQLQFSVNIDYEIELLHLFLIKAIKKSASISEISEAIGFSENEVREEFYNMCEYGYIEPDYKTLTTFSKEYLELVDFIENLNKELYSVYMNLMDGSLKKNINRNENNCFYKEEPKILFKYYRKCNDQDILFFKSNIQEFSKRSFDFINKVEKKLSWRCRNFQKDTYSDSDLIYVCE